MNEKTKLIVEIEKDLIIHRTHSLFNVRIDELKEISSAIKNMKEQIKALGDSVASNRVTGEKTK